MAYAEVFTALADPTRRHILEALRKQPKTVGELAEGQPVSRPAVSQHLKVLEGARLVSVEPRGQTVKALRVDAREGGQIVEVASDGHEQLWGTIKTYDPYGYLNMDFHIPHPTEKNPGFSTVEVRFTALADDRTRVELKQSNWEALGDVAKMVQGGYRQAWVMIFEGAYKAACGG